MPLSWNEIKTRAVAFSHKWKDEFSEDAEAKPFLTEFFEIFGVDRKRVATFEHKVKKLEGGDGYIDLLWKGTILVEHKSLGKSLVKAEDQARNYLHGLKDSELPRLLLMCDFQNFRLVDILDDSVTEFKLAELHNHVHLFGFMIGYVTKKVSAEDPVNIKAAEKMGALHDTLKEAGYEGHQLELLLVRLLFCLFAEDTGIFSKRQFQDYIEQRTAEDGSDLGMHLNHLFEILDTPESKRQKTLDEQLADFAYINGSLFTENLRTAAFDKSMRDALLGAATLDWSRISPAIFGSLFQSVMNPKERRSLGAHYTSETNILKLIGPLFLDDLRAEFESAKKSDKKLDALHKKIASFSFLDPACGCGNFLIIAYRELRKLEQDIIRELYRHGQQVSDISLLLRVTISQFHGIEIEEFPARIAEVALWLMDHQMNLAVSEEFGEYFVRIPLSKVDTVVCDNALRASWPTVDFILGNPPFLGSKMMSEEQRTDILSVADNLKNAGVLDFVTGWYLKASRLIAGTKTRVAFVSTNSICQGEQVGILWGELLERRNMQIHFAHRTFRWNNDARGVAAVHCVIVGFGAETVSKPVIFDYPDLKGDPVRVEAKQINGYLVDAPILSIENRSKPMCDCPQIGIGNKPIDNGNYLFTPEEKDVFIAIEPNSKELFYKWIGAVEFLNGIERWVLLVQKAEPSALKKMPEVLKRIDAVKQYRLASTSAPTRKIAETPTRFHVENFPKSTFLVIPEVSSEKRNYIPIGFMEPNIICSNLVKITSEATPFHFGVLSSSMHNSWMRTVAGRLESRYRYSNTIVYNNFPWPTPTEAQKSKIETCAQAVLDARAEFPTSTLADLYDPLTMPPVLLKAHQQLDKAVDSAYGKTKFDSESERVAFLFERYRELVEKEVASDKPKAARKKKGE